MKVDSHVLGLVNGGVWWEKDVVMIECPVPGFGGRLQPRKIV